MKHINPLILAAFTLAALSCSKEAQDAPEKVGGKGLVPMTVSATGADTKTYVDGTSIVWEDSDNLAIFDGTDKQVFSISNIDENKADFSGVVTEGSTDFYAVYPADYASALNAGVLTATLPAVQVIPAGKNVAHGAMLSVGKVAADKSLGLKNVFSYLTVEVTRDNIQSIVLNGTNLAGEATFNAEGVLQSVTSGVSTVTVTYANGAFPTGKYYIPVLPGTTAAGAFSVSMTALNGENADWCAEKVATNAVTLKKNEGLAFGELDTKVDWYFNIHDAASLERFRALVGAGTFPADDVAKFTSDIDLSGETLAAAAGTFKGTLDGQGHSITNWTSNGVSLFDTVNGPSLVQGITFDASCSLTPKVQAERFGFLAQTIHNDAVVTNCHNYADISIKVAEGGTTSTYLGAFVGVSYGTISECTNHGDITFETVGSGAVYMGGVVGYINANGDPNKENALLNNKNYGNILFKNTGKSANTYIGGITAGTSTTAIASATSSKGTMNHCENYGDITYYCTNGGSMEDNAGTAASANISKVGGVTGYFEGNITNCKNEGDVTVTFPTSETGATATAPSIGGVAAFVLMNISDCSNYGQVSLKGTFANAGGDAIPAGAGCVKEPCVGGLVGQVGTATGAEAYSISDCHNYGVMNIYTWMQPGNGTGVNIGGVVGYTKANVNRCSNEIASPGKMMVSNKMAYIRQGGVVGRIENSSASAYDLTNDSACNFVFLQTAGGNQIKSELHVGGVIGYSNAPAEKLCNKKAIDVTVTGDGATGDAQLRFGGVIARSSANVKDALNEGNITITKNAVSNGSVIGGVIGWGNTNLNDTEDATILENRGNITLQGTPTAVQTLYFGGVIGYPDGAQIKGAINSGNLLVNHNSGETNVGGIVGKNTSAAARFYNCSNSGTVTVESNTAKLNLGGIAGYNNNANFLLDNCVNQAAGEIAFSGTASAAVRVGGVIGSVDGGQMVFNSPANYADITVTGSTSADQNIGGLVGYAPSTKYNGCTVEATIESPSNANGFVGGIAGRTNVNNVTMKGCRLNVDVQYAANNYHGLVAGSHNTANQTVNLGTDSEPFTIVKGSKLGAVTVNSYTDISSSILYGNKNVFTLNYSESTLIIVE